ncbi:hypothetical protein EVA_09779 [gut metagenome]|uniref:Uncharacterized protein n=1 Tax=gut metagenome TaxID=749906 RepID=J9GJD0_9ZZZZ
MKPSALLRLRSSRPSAPPSRQLLTTLPARWKNAWKPVLSCRPFRVTRARSASAIVAL